MTAKDIKAAIKSRKRRKTREESFKASDFLSTGSTLLNLACTGHPDRGFAKGMYYFLVGDSISGKTFLSLTCLAEAAKNKNFKDYRFIHDDAENGALMDFTKYFGKAVQERVEPPHWDGNEPCFSWDIEDFYYNVDDAIKKGVPFIYILDSMDSLTSHAEGDKFDERKKAHRSGKEAKGSYGDGKAKFNSTMLRRLMTPMRKSGSILIIIAQTRDNVTGFGFEKKTRSGGKSLRFYACMEIWSSVKERIYKMIRGQKEHVGANCIFKIKKDRFSGKERKVSFPISYTTGIDDVAGCIDFLVARKHWPKSKAGIIDAEELELKGSARKLIKRIEHGDLEKDLQSVVEDVWNEIEEALEEKGRKKRYE